METREVIEDTLSASRARRSGVRGFEEEFGPMLEALSKQLNRLGRLKGVDQQVGSMNFGELRKQLDDVVRLGWETSEQAQAIRTALEGYRTVVSEADQSEWTARFKRAMQSWQRTVEGEFPVFRVFPLEIKVDFGNEQVTINKRIVRTLHPEAVARHVAKERDRLDRERFNPNQFLKALLRVYDALIAEEKVSQSTGEVGNAVRLSAVHKLLSVRSGPSGYSLGQFAFDIYRLRRDAVLTFEGRRLQFGSSRNRGPVVITLPGGQTETFGSLEVSEDRSDD